MKTQRDAAAEMGKAARINFRPALVSAFGLVFGIFLTFQIRFGGNFYAGLFPAAIFLFLICKPLKLRRVLLILLTVLCFSLIGAALANLSALRYETGAEEGEYTVTGTVTEFTAEHGYTAAVLSSLKFNGMETDGKLRGSFSGELLAGDVVTFRTKVSRCELEGGDSFSLSLFARDVRYSVTVSDYERTAGGDIFLNCNAAVYRVLHENLSKDGADVCYALLTGNSMLDEGISEAVRQGGIAHIFAVSGLHIGILFAALSRIFGFLKRYSCLPAFAGVLLYGAFCGFSVSATRAVIMCGVVALCRLTGRKYDFITSVSLAAVAVLLLSPAQLLTAGFRLSFGACTGLALFSGSMSRTFCKIGIPAVIAKYLGADLSVQLFTFPILLDCFGFVSVWGILFNLFLIPVLPLFYSAVFLATALSLVIPPAAGFFMLFPAGMVSPFLLFLSVADLSFVITGFSLGAAGAVFFAGVLVLSQRVNLKLRVRTAAVGGIAALFCVILALENVVPTGCKIVCYSYGEGDAVLLKTNGETVLLLDGDMTLPACGDFLNRTYGGKLDAVVVLSEDEVAALNVAVFLDAEAVYARDPVATGLQETQVNFGETVTVGALTLRLETREKATAVLENIVVEIDFENSSAFDADLFLGKGAGGLKFYLKDGIIRSL